jgi:hypothetical protein
MSQPTGDQRSLGLRDLAPSQHRDTDGNRLEISRQITRLIYSLPPRKRTVLGGFESDAFLTGWDYHTVSALSFALVTASENRLGRENPSKSQRIAKVCETVRVTQQVSELRYFPSEEILRGLHSRHLSNPVP